MLNLLSSITKAAVAVAVTPVAVIADVVNLPNTAYVGEDAFKHTSKVLSVAAENINNAIDPNK